MLYVRGAHAVGELDCANLILRRFLDKPSSPESNNAVAEILRSFNIPDFLNTRTCIDLNGYFGCRGKYKEEHDKEEHDKDKYNKEEHNNEEHDKEKHNLESYSMML
jgi:ABC-type Zn2+ transport system substrate-binding protein/surface adhesin